MRVTRCLLAVAIALAVGDLAAPVAAFAQGVRADDPAPQATLEKVDAAHVAFYNGNPEPSKAIWSHAPDVTLAGGAGGAIEKGWERVRPRLEWASAQYTRGRQRNERVSVTASGDPALVVQYEHIWFHPPGQEGVGASLARYHRPRPGGGQWRGTPSEPRR